RAFMAAGTATIVLALLFYVSLVALVEIIETTRERRAARAAQPNALQPAPAAATTATGVAHRSSGRNTLAVSRPALLDFVWTTLFVAAAAAVSFALFPDVLASEDV